MLLPLYQPPPLPSQPDPLVFESQNGTMMETTSQPDSFVFESHDGIRETRIDEIRLIQQSDSPAATASTDWSVYKVILFTHKVFCAESVSFAAAYNTIAMMPRRFSGGCPFFRWSVNL